MSALFGLSLDEMVKGDEQVMAQALERDKNHLLIAGETFNPGNEQPRLPKPYDHSNLFGLRSTGGPAHGKFEDADVTDPYGLAYRLVRVATLFSRGLYHILDEHGCKVGSITRKHALQHPVFQVRMKGFDRVQLRRETRIDNGYKDIIRIDGGGVSVEDNLMGDEFSIERNDSAIAHINVRRALNRTAYGIEIVDDASAPLALGLTFAILMLRDYDRVWVRGAGRVSI